MARTVPTEPAEDSTRKSGRERKSVVRLQDEHKPTRRKSAAQEEGSENETVPSDSEPETSSAEEEESEPEFGQKRVTQETPRASKPRKSTGDQNGSAKKGPGRPRKSRSAEGAGAGGSRKARAAGAEGEQPFGEAAGGMKGDLVVNGDNTLFNAVRNPNSALQTTVDDWVQSYDEDDESTGPAMAELVIFLLRACGCNSSVDEHQAEDQDAIVDNLEDIQTAFKQDAGLYPLISRSKQLKKFRASLSDFLRRLFTTAAAQDILFDDKKSFFATFEAWLTSLSSSKIRAFRHTSTVIALMSVSALNEITQEAKKEDAKFHRAKEAEEKKGRKDKQRLQEMKRNCEQSQAKLDALAGFLDDLFTDIFVNRYRDADPQIRAECIASLGSWMKQNPDQWLEGDYLRYIGWVLSDEATVARRESVRALFALYAKEDNIGALQHFTERFKGQLVHMATGEVDIHVRIQAIHVLRQIEHHGLLDDDQRDTVAQLVFEKERRVRVAAADFFNGIVQEELDRRWTELEAAGTSSKQAKKRKGATKAPVTDSETKEQLELKCLAELLVKYGRALDGTADEAEEDADDEDEESARKKREEVELLEVRTHRGRVGLAVEGLWEDVEAVRNWQQLVEFLLLDHSADSAEVESACKLSDEEETVLVELLVGALKHVSEAAASPNQKAVDQDRTEEELADVSRAMMDALPRLFTKHQSVPMRMVDLLSVPRLCALGLYVDMRRVNAYEALWDDVSKQFLAHTHPDVLDQAVQTIVHLNHTAQLAKQNEEKLTELGDAVTGALRELLAGKDVEADSFDEDELPAAIAGLSRLAKLFKQVDLSPALLETDGGKQSSAYEIVELISTRAKLGYADEADLVEHALEILSQYAIWHIYVIRKQQQADPSGDDIDFAAIADLNEKRGAFLDRLEQLVTEDGCSPAESVKQAAVGLLFDQHCFAKSATSSKVDPNGRLADLALTMSDELQARCVGYVEAEIDRHAEEIAEIDQAAPDEALEEDDDAPSDEENAGLSVSQRKKKGKQSTKKGKKKADGSKHDKSPAAIRAENGRQESRRVAQRQFERTLAPCVRALDVGVLALEHTAVLIPHLGRFGPAFDAWVKWLIEKILRAEACYGNNARQVAAIVVACIAAAAEAYVDQDNGLDPKLPTTRTEDSLVHLGRALVGAIAVRGPNLRFVKQIPLAERVRIQTDALERLTTRVGQLDKAKRTEQRSRALAGFRCLTQLLFNIDGKDALKIKSDLDALLRKQGIEDVPGTAKAWEPVRAYYKRLTTLMAKDESIKQAAAKQVARNKAHASDAEQDEQADDEDPDADALGEEEAMAELTSPAAQKSARSKKRQSIVLAPATQDEDEEVEALPKRKKRRALVDAPEAEPELVEQGPDVEDDPIEEEEELGADGEGDVEMGEEAEEIEDATTQESGRARLEREESVQSFSDFKKKSRRRAGGR